MCHLEITAKKIVECSLETLMLIVLGNLLLGDNKLFSETKINNSSNDYYKHILQTQKHFY